MRWLQFHAEYVDRPTPELLIVRSTIWICLLGILMIPGGVFMIWWCVQDVFQSSGTSMLGAWLLTLVSAAIPVIGFFLAWFTLKTPRPRFDKRAGTFTYCVPHAFQTATVPLDWIRQVLVVKEQYVKQEVANHQLKNLIVAFYSVQVMLTGPSGSGEASIPRGTLITVTTEGYDHPGRPIAIAQEIAGFLGVPLREHEDTQARQLP